MFRNLCHINTIQEDFVFCLLRMLCSHNYLGSVAYIKDRVIDVLDITFKICLKENIEKNEKYFIFDLLRNT